MINVEDARKALANLFDEVALVTGYTFENYDKVGEFINEVERLLKHNSIKQVPALFKEKK